MTDIQKMLREMRLYADENNYGPDVGRWLIAIEAAMREPVAWWVEDENGEPYGKGRYAVRFMPDNRPGRTVTPLFALPSDAQAELVRITEQLAERDAEVERLKALWYADVDPMETEYAEDYRSRAALTVKEGK